MATAMAHHCLGQQAVKAPYNMRTTGAVELRNAVSGRFGVELPATMTFDYPTVAAMASFLAARLAPPAAVGTVSITAAAPPSELASTLTTELIGMSSIMAVSGAGHEGEFSGCLCPCPFQWYHAMHE